MTDTTPRILLVEDEPNLARGIRENLEAEGYHVDVLGDGRVALTRIRQEEFNLIVLDVMLPGMDGFSVCETMRREGRDTPVLFLSHGEGRTQRPHPRPRGRRR
jgi:DNA-binding response OmpR family regulator